MGQREVLDFLKKHPDKFFSCKELYETGIMGCSYSRLYSTLNILRKHKLIYFETIIKDLGKWCRTREVFIYRFLR